MSRPRTTSHAGLLSSPIDATRHLNPALVCQACRGMLYDFATTSRADEERITEELKRRGLYPRVHIFEKPLDTPYPALAGPASQYRRCVACA